MKDSARIRRMHINLKSHWGSRNKWINELINGNMDTELVSCFCGTNNRLIKRIQNIIAKLKYWTG